MKKYHYLTKLNPPSGSASIVLILLLLFLNPVFAQEKNVAINDRLEIPSLKKGDDVICHTGYCFLYNEKHEQSSWVAYELTAGEAAGGEERTDNFSSDPSVKTGTANNKDYSKSGYDRGHLAPAADMGWSEKAMKESFYFSNMSPQKKELNRGIWKKLEEQVREWAAGYGSLYIVTGPVLKDGLKKIGKQNKVSVPELYYKVILVYNNTDQQAIAFLMKNQKPSSKMLQSYVVTVDEVEKITGIDFYPLLPDKAEKQLESTVNKELWDW